MCAAVEKLKAVIPGGSSVPVVPAEIIMDLTMDFDTIRDIGSGLGTCAMVVMDETHLHGQHAKANLAFLSRGVLRSMHAVSRRDGLALPDVDPHSPKATA